MTTHALIATDGEITFADKLNEKFYGQWRAVGSNVAYISSAESAKDVYDKLDLDNGPKGVLILGLSGDYWGRNERSNWEWLKASFEKK